MTNKALKDPNVPKKDEGFDANNVPFFSISMVLFTGPLNKPVNPEPCC